MGAEVAAATAAAAMATPLDRHAAIPPDSLASRERGAADGRYCCRGTPSMRPAATILIASLVVMAASQAAQAKAGSRIGVEQTIVTLLGKHKVLEEPDVDGKLIGSVAAKRPITAVRTALPLLAQKTDAGGRSWLRVRLPGRKRKGEEPPPTGWISASRTRRSTTPWQIVVDVSRRQVEVYRDGRRERSYPAIVGKRSTPTPHGEYFVEENVRLAKDRPGAPFALATSARSKVIQEFDGGPGQIAIHGRDNIGGKLGTAVSHGCVRLGDGAVSWLAARVEPGAPVSIR